MAGRVIFVTVTTAASSLPVHRAAAVEFASGRSSCPALSCSSASPAVLARCWAPYLLWPQAPAALLHRNSPFRAAALGAAQPVLTSLPKQGLPVLPHCVLPKS